MVLFGTQNDKVVVIMSSRWDCKFLLVHIKYCLKISGFDLPLVFHLDPELQRIIHTFHK